MHEIFSKANSINLFLYLSEVFNFFTFYLHDCCISFNNNCCNIIKFHDNVFYSVEVC